MEKWSLNNLEIEAFNAELTDDIIRDLKTPVSQRRNFRHNPYVVTIPKYYYRFIGIRESEDSYYENLYRIEHEMRKLGPLYRRFDNGLDKNIGLSLQNKLADICSHFLSGAGPDTAELISTIAGQGLMKELDNIVLSLQMKNNFKGLLDYYLRINAEWKPENIRLIVYHTVHWINLYFKDLFSTFDYGAINPKVLFFGEITREECFFLNLLSTLGCDILYFNPRRSGEFSSVDKFNSFSREVLYVLRRDPKPFPDAPVERIKTTAYSAKEELNKTLFSEDSSFYRPWQLSDHRLKAVTLKTTYEEVNIWMKEKALIRDGWKVENRTVFVPNIFAKISGTHKELDKYWKEVNHVISQKNTLFLYKKLPLIEIVPLEYGKLEQVFPSRGSSELDVEKLLRASWWKYRELRTGLQRNIAEKIKYLCLNPMVINVENTGTRDFQVDIFSVLINLDVSFQQLLQGFDLPEEVPKIVVFNNEQNGNLSYEDCIALTFMNQMGVDIIIYNPSGYNDIENYVYSELYDIHRLENISFNLPYKKYVEKKGFFKSIFG